MADFTASYIGGPPGSPVSPQAPVQDTSSLVGLSFLGDVVGALGGAAVNFAEAKREQEKEALKLQIEEQENIAISTFSRKQLQLVDAVEMGDLSSSEARMRMRANLSRQIADNPSLAVDLAKAHTAVVKTTGLGDVVYEGTEAENQQLGLERDAVKAGWVKPSWSDEQKQSGVEAYTQFKRSIELMEAQQKKVSLQAAQVGLTTAGITQQSARLRLVEQQEKRQSQQALGSAAGAYQVKLGNDLEGIRQAKEKGEITAEQATMMVDQAYLNVQQVVSQVGSQAGSEYVSSLAKPMQMMVDNYKGYVSGKLKLESLQTDNDIAVGMQIKMMSGDPEIAALIATSKLFPNSSVVTMGDVNEKVADFLKRGSQPDKKPVDVLPDYDEDKVALNTSFQLLTENMDKINNGSAKDLDETKVEVNTYLNDVLKGVDVYSGTESNPSSYKSVIDFLASPSVGRFVSTQGGFQDNEAAFKAAQVLQYQYDTALIPLIQKEWERSMTAGEIQTLGKSTQVNIKNQKPTPSVIKPQFIGSGVTFMAPPGDTNYLTRQRVKELNKDVAPLLNKMIRTQAHLAGNKDYKAIWASQYEQKVFGEMNDADANKE